MKTSTTLALFLAGSVILNAYLYFKDPGTMCCPPIPGFETPRTISNSEARGFINEYKDRLKEPEIINGGVITRKAFDDMLCIEGCNAITYSFAWDKTGETGPGERGVFLIVSGAKVTMEADGTIASVDNIGSAYYITKHWCPPSCMPL